ncbi:MAG: PAS domain-containing protein, partial [Actinomycetota bacterium]
SRRKRAEAERLEAEEQFRTLVETVPAITYIDRGPEGHTGFFVSPQLQEILGYTPQQWLASDDFWHDHIHEEDRTRVVSAWERSIATHEPFNAEYRMMRADGSLAWISERSNVLPATDEHDFQIQGVLFDITDSHDAKEALVRAEARYRKLVESMPVAPYVENRDASPEGFYMSPQIEKLTGWPPERFLARTFWSSRLHPDDSERVLALDLESNENGTPFTAEYRFLRPDGSAAWLLDEAVLQPGARGKDSWHGVIVDITERRLAEARVEQALEVEREAAQELRALDEAKNTFLEAVAHDLRTPLSAILGLAVTLERPDMGLEPEETQQLAGRIAANARKLDGLVRDMLDLDRLTQGIVEPQLEAVAL